MPKGVDDASRRPPVLRLAADPHAVMMAPLDAAALMMTVPAMVPATVAATGVGAAAVIAPVMPAVVVALRVCAAGGPESCCEHPCRDHDLTDLHGWSFVTRDWAWQVDTRADWHRS